EPRLAARDILGRLADTRPDRIDLIEAPYGPCLILSHSLSLPAPLGSPPPPFITISQLRRERRKAPMHGSSALVKEFDNAGLIDLVANGEHVVAVGNIESVRPRDKRGQSLGIARDLIFCPDRHQNRHSDTRYLGA